MQLKKRIGVKDIFWFSIGQVYSKWSKRGQIVLVCCGIGLQIFKKFTSENKTKTNQLDFVTVKAKKNQIDLLFIEKN